MINLLATLLSLLNRIMGWTHDRKVEEQGRQQAIEDVKDAAEAEVAKVEAAVAVADPVRDQRLRHRFDAAQADPGTPDRTE